MKLFGEIPNQLALTASKKILEIKARDLARYPSNLVFLDQLHGATIAPWPSPVAT